MTQILTQEYKKTFWSIITLISVLSIVYLLCISSSVFNTVALEDAEIQIGHIQSNLALVETAYIQKDTTINQSMALAMGFNEVRTSTFSYAGLSSSVSRTR